MPDDPGETPQHSFRRGGPAAIFSFEVKGPRNAVVVMAVEHREQADAEWSGAGALSALAPAESALRVSGLKEELRLKFTVVGGAAGDVAQVHMPPPTWLPD